MALYRYIKSNQITIYKGKPQRKKLVRYTNLLAKVFLAFGFITLANVALPIISYELFTAPSLRPQTFLSPVPAIGIEKEDLEIKPETNLSNPQNWFPQAQFSKDRESKITHYTLSIPRFKIKNATVEIGGEDLSKSLIHYPGTALPGQLGATIIFGHSVLPQFFNPNNYMAIFSLIPTLELGDDIIIKFDGIRYTYRVIDKVEVKPDNLSVLDQPYDNEYLRLITCTPPGTYLRRGVITAALVD